jgi:hypothetical protein
MSHILQYAELLYTSNDYAQNDTYVPYSEHALNATMPQLIMRWDLPQADYAQSAWGFI